MEAISLSGAIVILEGIRLDLDQDLDPTQKEEFDRAIRELRTLRESEEDVGLTAGFRFKILLILSRVIGTVTNIKDLIDQLLQ